MSWQKENVDTLQQATYFLERWKTLFSSCQCHIVVHPVLYQRLTDTMYKKMLGRRITVIRHAGEDVDPLTLNDIALCSWLCMQTDQKQVTEVLSFSNLKRRIHFMHGHFKRVWE